MLIRRPADIPSAEITPKAAYFNRRGFLAGAALSAASVAGAVAIRKLALPSRKVEAAGQKLAAGKSPLSDTGETLTPYNDVTTYNNFYEFGTDKSDPSRHAGRLRTRPWTMSVEGLVRKPFRIDIDRLLKLHPIEERVYRHRCVEAWSMVVPWAGYSLAEFIRLCEPLSSAKYVQFLSLDDPNQMPWMRDVSLHWPYSEGLRLDEAMHPLTLLTFGLYGEVLPNQDGAPVRLVVPWKYGFKGAKSIVTVRFVDRQPRTTWNEAAANEYGFYSNVNPNRDHPRWSQKTERRIGAPFWKQRMPTQMFNGYGAQVAHLYAGMDLIKYF